MRSAALLLWVLAVGVLLLLVLRRAAARPRPGRPVLRDELVKDPICQTYVVRSRAVTRSAAAGPVFFCSAECARRYAGAAGD